MKGWSSDNRDCEEIKELSESTEVKHFGNKVNFYLCSRSAQVLLSWIAWLLHLQFILSLELKHAMFVYTEFLDHNDLKINSELP